MRLVLPLLLLLPLSAAGKLEIKNVQPAHGPLGPPRASDDIYPLDEYAVRYQVTGVKPDKDGQADLEGASRLTGPDGKVVFERKAKPTPRPLSLGGDTVQSSGFFTVPEKAAPGEYTFTVSVRDRTSNETASFERKLTLKPADFRILTPRFYLDEEGKVPAPTTLVAGQTLYYHLTVVGFDKSQKVALVLRAQVTDADGKDVGAKPLEVKTGVADPAEAEKSRKALLKEKLTLNRPGDFKLKVTVGDVVGKKTATFEAPLKVLAP